MSSKSRTAIAARQVARRLFVENLEFRLLLAAQPTVTTVSPVANATGVALNMPVTAALNLPNGGIDPATVTNATMSLVQTSSGTAIPAVVNTTGGGDALILTPSINLLINTKYTFTVTAGVKDINGDPMVPFTESFTTGATAPPINQTIAFQKIALPTTQGTPFTDMKIGPDGLLYASTEDGRIFRYVMNADGTLGTPQIITTLQTAEGGKRLITGFAFDPAATPTNPIIWVSNTFYALSGATNGPNFTSKLTVMSGLDLGTVTDAVINLPRSVADHVNNQPVFQPGTTNLFFCQAGQNAYGAPDTTWGNRPETLLSAAILEVNTSALNLSGPALNVLTPDVGGTYSPYASGAPLTLYATGVRNAFPLFFDEQGQLWAAVNGSSAGGNTPAFNSGDPNQINGNRIDTGQPYAGPNVAALTNVQQTEEDVMDKIVKGAYYGHPDPARGEFVLNDGNPTSGGIPGLAFTAYPSGTNPDPNYHLPNFVFGLHNSPDAIVEYSGSAFGGALNGKFLVTEYSAGDDIVALSRDANDNISSADRTISGFSGFGNPLALIENPATGFLYVSELGSGKITLLKPSSVAPEISATTSANVANVVAFNTIAAGNTGAGPSRVETVTITNNGANPLTFGSGAFSIVNDPSTTANAANFTITNAGSLPASLASGASATIKLQYSATAVAIQSALLQINSNDPITPTLTINLHGIGTPGQFGVLEPSLVQVLRAHNIPTIVGAGPNDVNINTQKYPINPDPSSQEVPMQRLIEATPGPVTITPIASFSSATQPVSQIGFYTPGDPSDSTELFYINKADAQTVDPIAQGATSFDPGVNTPFGLYGQFVGTSTPNGSIDIHYSEDALNTLDPTHPRKIRFFPMESANGTPVPNTYVVAFEDYNDPTQFNSFINFVGIISNVMAAPNATLGSTPSSPAGDNPPVMGVQLNQPAPASSTLIFNTIQNVNPITADVVHNTSSVTIHNTGDQLLVINSLTLANTTPGSNAPASSIWKLVNPPAPGTSIAAGSSLTVTVQFVATSTPPHTINETNDTASTSLVSVINAGGVWNGTLTIVSNDPIASTNVVNLAGYWQYQTEHENEPGVQTITSLMLGYQTSDAGSASTSATEYPNNGSSVILYGNEVDPSTNQGLFVAAQANEPVQLTELASFHQQFISYTATVGSTVESIASASESGTTVTITTTGNHGFSAGQQVMIAGIAVNGYNGTFTIATVTSTTFTYTAASSGLATSVPAPTTAASGWYPAGGSSKFLYKDQPLNGQAFFPLLQKDSFSTVQTSFTPAGAFGLNLDGEKTQDAQNAGDLALNRSGHSIRVFPVVDGNGNVVPNTWIVGMDYQNGPFDNDDYQDLVMILSNATFEGAPGTPSDLQATLGTSGVNLQWAPSNGAASYNVLASVNGGAFTQVNTSAIITPGYLDTTSPSGAAIKYQVVAVNGTNKSLPASASVNLVGPNNGQTTSGPAAPTIVSADGSSGTQVVLSWSAPMGATSYILQREDPGASSFTQIATGLTKTTFTDTNVTAGSTYQYRVEAKDASGVSPFSTPAQATVTLVQTSPSAPTNLVAAASGADIVLGWDASTGATSYNVSREDPGSSTFNSIGSGLTTTGFTDTTVTAGATYMYEVQAANSAGSSPFTSPIAFTAPAAAPLAPANLKTSISSGNSVVLTWDASLNATSYNVLREDPASSAFTQIAMGLTNTTYTDTAVLMGQTYQYEVFAQNGAGASPDSAAVAAVLPQPGATLDIPIGKGSNKFVQFTTSNNTLTTIRLGGKGLATVHFTGDTLSQVASKGGVILVGTNVAIASIHTTGTVAASSVLSVMTKGGSKTVNLGAISADASLHAIMAGTATLIGSLSINGSINNIVLGSAGAASITVGSLGTLQIGSATGVSLTSTGAVQHIIAGNWTSNRVITAPSINSINVKGDAEINVTAGSLHSLHVKGMLHDSTFTLTAAGAVDLAMLGASSIVSTRINAVGNLGAISAIVLDNSQIDAGTGPASTFPPVSTSFPAAAVIASINLRKVKGVFNDVNSSIAASTISHANLGRIQFSNGGIPFGLEANLVTSLAATDPTTGKPFTFKKLTSQAAVTADFAAKSINPEDFTVEII